jgi:hypothetical protein
VEEKNSLQSRFIRIRFLELTGQSLEKTRPWPLLLWRRRCPWSMELFFTSVLGGLWWESQQDPALFLPSSVAPGERMGDPPGDLPSCAQWAGHTSCSECSLQVVELQGHDLCNSSHQDFWTIWSGTRASLCSMIESEATQLLKKKGKVNGSWTNGCKTAFCFCGGAHRSVPQEKQP